jgi:hypothetical protein
MSSISLKQYGETTLTSNMSLIKSLLDFPLLELPLELTAHSLKGPLSFGNGVLHPLKGYEKLYCIWKYKEITHEKQVFQQGFDEAKK